MVAVLQPGRFGHIVPSGEKISKSGSTVLAVTEGMHAGVRSLGSSVGVGGAAAAS